MENEYLTLLNEFLEEEKIRGRRLQGLIGLRSRVPMFFRYLDETEIVLLQVNIQEANGYQGWLIGKGKESGGKYSNRTIASYLVAVTAFYEFLKRNDKILSNPFKEIRRVKTEKKLPEVILKEKELSLFLSELSRFNDEDTLKRTMRKYKAHVVSELLYSTGMRITEAASLKVSDIELQRGIIHVRNGKGGSNRVCYLNEYTQKVLNIYVDRIRPLIRNSWHKDPESLFFTGWQRFGKVMNEVLKETCKASGVGKITCHGFRHAVGYHLLRAGCSIRWIQEILGHKRLRNTEIYTKVDKEDLKEVLDTCHPRKWKKING